MAKIIGIGNALVDVIVNIPEESLLQEFGLPKGGMEMIDVEKKRQIHERISTMKQVRATGGSTSNTIHGIAHLGGETGYIGKVGNDEVGRFFEEDMKKNGICPHLIHTSDIDTGIATTLMTEDAERTFATYLGAAASMTADEVDVEILKAYDCIHVEGYLIFNHDLILRACQLAKENGLKISMDMASYNLVQAEKAFVGELLSNYVDIIFANEEEAEAFTGKRGEQALEELSRYCEVAVVKLGAKGSIANIRGTHVSAGTNGKKPVDTNGAGDAYAAGFLYGLMHGLAPEKTIQLAAVVGDEAVATVGAKLSDQQWDNIKSQKSLF